MHLDLERIARVHQLDRQLHNLDHDAEKQRKSLKDANALVVQLAGERESLQAAMQGSKSAEHEGQRKAKRYKDRRSSAQRMLDQGMGDPDAAQRQISQCNEILDELDTDVLEQMEVQDDLDGKLQANQKTQDQAKAQSISLEQSVPKELGVIRDKRANVQAKRDDTFAPLEEDLKYKYKQLVIKKRTAVAILDKDVCSSCQIVVQNQQISDLKRGLIKPCRGCHRWLVFPDAHET